MPNWCYNKLEVSGAKDAVADFQTQTTNDEGHFSLDRLVPMPAELKAPDAGDGWYDWSIKNWGTKWDVRGDEVDVQHTVPQEGSACLAYDFMTAWAPPSEWLQKVAGEFTNLKFSLWFDEPGADFSGLETFADGSMDLGSSWSGSSIGTLKCSVSECDEYVDGFPVTNFTKAPEPEELEVFCEDHALVEAVVHAERETGGQVSLA